MRWYPADTTRSVKLSGRESGESLWQLDELCQSDTLSGRVQFHQLNGNFLIRIVLGGHQHFN